MKTMTCKQLGGACDKEFHANTFEQMAELSKKHGIEMQKDSAHQKAMQKMMEIIKNPKEMQNWTKDRKKDFDALPEDK